MIPALWLHSVLEMAQALENLVSVVVPAQLWQWLSTNVLPLITGWAGLLTRVIPQPIRVLAAVSISTTLGIVFVELGIRVYERIKNLIPGA